MTVPPVSDQILSMRAIQPAIKKEERKKYSGSDHRNMFRISLVMLVDMPRPDSENLQIVAWSSTVIRMSAATGITGIQ